MATETFTHTNTHTKLKHARERICTYTNKRENTDQNTDLCKLMPHLGEGSARMATNT